MNGVWPLNHFQRENLEMRTIYTIYQVRPSGELQFLDQTKTDDEPTIGFHGAFIRILFEQTQYVLPAAFGIKMIKEQVE